MCCIVWRKHKNTYAFLSFCLHWDGASGWNCSALKMGTHLSNRLLMTWWCKELGASATMALTSWNIPASVSVALVVYVQYMSCLLIQVMAWHRTTISHYLNQWWLCWFILAGVAICWHGSGSTLAQVMACCLPAPSHYLTQCWLIIS